MRLCFCLAQSLKVIRQHGPVGLFGCKFCLVLLWFMAYRICSFPWSAMERKYKLFSDYDCCDCSFHAYCQRRVYNSCCSARFYGRLARNGCFCVHCHADCFALSYQLCLYFSRRAFLRKHGALFAFSGLCRQKNERKRGAVLRG